MSAEDGTERQQGALRKSGIEIAGDMPWGTHFCQFYQTSQDLIEIVVPYIIEGLAAKEFCMWVTSGPLSVEQAEAALRAAFPNLDEHAARGQIEILDYRQWYTKAGEFEPHGMLRNWVGKLEEALRKGFAGLRLCGDTFWLTYADREVFAFYEETVNSVIGRYRMLALCTYCLERCTATDIVDVVANHKLALMKRAGKWEVFARAEGSQPGQLPGESEERFRILAENTYDFEFWLDPEGRFIYASPACERTTGHKPEEFLADPGLRFRIVHPDDRPLLLRHAREETQQRAAAEFEHRIVLPDGSERWVHHVCQPVYGNDGTFLGTRGSNRDITERKRVEEALRRLSQFPEENPNPVLRVAADGRLLYANPPARDWLTTLGWQADGPLPQPVLALVINTRGQNHLVETDIRNAAGSTSWLSAIQPPGEDYVNIYGRDITERWQAEEALAESKRELEVTAEELRRQNRELVVAQENLRESEERFRSLAEAMPQIAWSADPSGAIDYYNSRAYEYSGLRPGDIEGWNWTNVIHPEDLELTLAAWQGSMATGEDYQIEHRLLRGDGEYRWHLTRGVAARDKNGGIVRWFGTATEIHEQKLAEEALERRVQERTAELLKANEALGAEIAERKRAEGRAQTERRRLYEVLETLPVYVILLSEDYHVPFANRFFRERFGESHGRRCFEYLFHRTEPCETCETYTVLKTNGPHRWEWTGPDNRNYDIYDFPFIDSDGTRMILEMGIDVTEVRNSQEALIRKEQGLAEAQRIAHLGNWDWNITTNELTWSDEVYRIFGLESQEFVTTYDAFLKSVHPDDREFVKEAVNRALADPNVPYSIEHRVIRRDGEQRVVHERGEVTFDETGKPVRMIGTVHDITDRKQAEEALRQSKDFLQTVIDGIPDPTMVIGRDHRVLLANRGARLLAGGDPVEQGLRCFEVLHRHEAPCADPSGGCPLEIVMRTKRPALTMHTHYSHKGDEIVVETNAAPIFDAAGEVIQVVESCRDVSEKLRSEKEARKLREELTHVARVATMGELAASLAHELNQPLAAISSNARAAQRFMDRTPPGLEEVREALEDVVRDGHRAGEVIRRLRALLKKGELERMSLNINEVAEEIVSLVHSEAVTKGVSMRMELGSGLPPVWGDRIQIQQVLMNLMMNGMEAMAEVEPSLRELVVTIRPHDPDSVRVSVQDAGTGLDEETMGQLFTPFFTTKAAGMGMGLAIGRSIVEAHGGKLWATYNPDRGATFHFTLPVKSEGGV